MPGSGTALLGAEQPRPVSVNPSLQTYCKRNNDHVESEFVAALNVTANGFKLGVVVLSARVIEVPFALVPLVRICEPNPTEPCKSTWFKRTAQLAVFAKAPVTKLLKFHVTVAMAPELLFVLTCKKFPVGPPTTVVRPIVIVGLKKLAVAPAEGKIAKVRSIKFVPFTTVTGPGMFPVLIDWAEVKSSSVIVPA